ncbi:MAG: hypothetical protein CMJ58_22505 [Planctomycetaceae bacterium]|nr:hypothetical protein [Planctomycetaceae bacterium]
MQRLKTRHFPRLATLTAHASVLTAAALIAAAAGVVRPGYAQDALPAPAISAETIAPGGAEFAGQEMVAEVRVVGNETVPLVKVEEQMTTRAGRPFDISVVNRDVRRLAHLGWFVDVKAKTKETPQGRIVVFEVVERPTIRYVEYLGNERMSDKALAKQTLLKVGGSVDPQSVLEGRRKLIDHYRGKGFNNVQVTVLEGGKATDKGIVYLINEGQPQKIGAIKFVGNEFISSSRLRKAVVKTKKPILGLWKGYVDYDTIANDVDQLTAYYRAFGYFQARVGRKIDFDETGGKATVTFVINEGPRYMVRNVRYMGNTKFEPGPLAEQAKVQNGQPFEQSKMSQTTDWLQELYGSRGYVFADIRPETVFLEEPGQVDLVYHIDEGKQWRVGRIFVHIGGDNPHTRIQTALNRVTLRPGDIMDIRELKASERRLQASSLFLVDAATGQKPKITYKIPEDYEMQLAAGEGEMRGQSLAAAPEPFRPVPLLPPPSAEHLAGFDTGQPQIAAQRDASDVHVYCDDYEHYLRWVETEEIATTPGAVMPASYEQPVGEPAAAAPPQPAAGQRVTPHGGEHLEMPPVPSNPHSIPLSTPPERRRETPPVLAEPIFRGQSPEPAPRRDAWWLRPATSQAAAATSSPASPTHHWANRPAAPNVQGAAPPSVGVAHSQFAAAAQYGNRNAAAQAAQTAAPSTPPQRPSQTQWYGQSYGQPQSAAATVPPTQQPMRLAQHDTYGAVRGQSPAASGQAVYSGLTTAPAATNGGYSPYGGQTVQATSPASAPIRDSHVQATQYSSQIQPPAGSIAPTPLSPQGPVAGNMVFPDAQWGPVLQPYDDQAVDIHISAAETQTGRLQMGFGVNSDAGVVGNFVIDERNFNWRQVPTSWEDWRTGRAWRGDGQRFRLEASPGSQVNRYLASFSDPYFLDRPITLGLAGSFFDRRYNDWDEQRLGGRISLGYQWVERDLQASLTYRGENVNIHDPRGTGVNGVPDLDEVLGDNVVHGFGVTVINDVRDSSFLPTRGYYSQLTAEQVIGSYVYPRVIGEFRKYWRLYERPDHSGAQVLSFSTNIGWTGDDTPIFERFYAGGFSTMRGFDFRGASPIRDTFEVGGKFQWINSLQYLFPLTADDMLHGVAFCDFGTVEETVTIKDFRVAPGLGLRVTVPAMGPAPIALDFAWAVNHADFDDRQVFSFSVGYSR